MFGNSLTRARMYLNDGKGSFTDATSALPGIDQRTFALRAADVDADGDLDLVLGNHGQNRLYLGDGKGRFTDVTSTNMPADADFTNDLELVDLDRDGDLDLVLANGFAGLLASQNRVYLGDGKGKFTDATASLLPAIRDATIGVAAGDIDHDGDVDLLFSNGAHDSYSGPDPDRVLLNDGKGRFVDSPAMLPDDVYELYVAPGYGPAGALAVPILSLHELAPAVSIPPFGALRIDLARSITLPAVAVPGRTTVSVAVPNTPALSGLTLFHQAVLLPSGNPQTWRLSNLVGDPVLR